MQQTVQEAVLLVNLDRDARDVVIVNDVAENTRAICDGDRMVQVFVNLIRNAVDATRTMAREASEPRPWKMGESPPDYIDTMLANIVGIEIVLTRLVGKSKLSQNREPRDRLNAADTLAGHGREELARAMRETGS
jgi:predicted FMN-binding regulatory protein PaiB